jgi:hypothetical protein
MSVPTETVVFPATGSKARVLSPVLVLDIACFMHDGSGHARERELASELKQLEREVQVNGDRKSKMVQ